MTTEITKEQTLEKIKSHFSDEFKEIESVIFASENILNGRIGLPVVIKYVHRAKSGRVTVKKKEIFFYPPFDPFTGEDLTGKDKP